MLQAIRICCTLGVLHFFFFILNLRSFYMCSRVLYARVLQTYKCEIIELSIDVTNLFEFGRGERKRLHTCTITNTK